MYFFRKASKDTEQWVDVSKAIFIIVILLNILSCLVIVFKGQIEINEYKKEFPCSNKYDDSKACLESKKKKKAPTADHKRKDIYVDLK